MPTHLTPEQHLAGLRDAVVAFVRYADRAGPTAAVPTCPEWTVLDLVAHQGMVHRWAAALVRGERPGDEAVAAFEAAGRVSSDLGEWLREGALEVARAVTEAPEDRAAPVFLHDAPVPRRFWARRQCHETTIHAVDALSATLGRYPVAADATWIGTGLALDGIDELLTGFLPRPVSRLRAEDGRLIAVRPDEDAGGWLVELSAGPPRTTRFAGASPDADVELTGSAVSLYLTLWNRSDEASPGGGWDDWRDSAQVTW